MNKLDKDYTALLQDILDNGVKKGDRTGTGTISVFGRQIRHKMSDGFPILTTKKMYFKGIVTELLWFLNGDTNIKYLIDNNCHIWDGDAYRNYRNQPQFLGHEDIPSKEWFISEIKSNPEFAKKFGDMGPIYGKQWRKWHYRLSPDWRPDNALPENCYEGSAQIDQIQNLIDTLKKNPDDRRMMVTAWHPGEIDSAVLPPCHYGFQVWTRELSWGERFDICDNKEKGNITPFTEKIIHYQLDMWNVPRRAISLMWNQRSVDTFLGLPFNITSYGLLLEILAKEVNMIPYELIGNLGDTHLYSNHIEQVKEQLGREPFDLPTLDIKLHFKNKPSFVPELWKTDDFELKNYQYHPEIKAPLSN
jgi:thymidylate synthase